MYTIDTELLPLECEASEARSIYFGRSLFFVAVIAVGLVPFYSLFLWLAYTHPPGVLPVAFLWFAFVTHSVAAFILAYFAWMYRGSEDAIRSYALIIKVLDESINRLDRLSEWGDSLKLSENSTDAQAEELENFISHAKLELKDLHLVIDCLTQKLPSIKTQSSTVDRRIHEVNQRIDEIQVFLSNAGKAKPVLRNHPAL